MLHKFSTWILFASAPVNSYSMPFSSFSFPSLFLQANSLNSICYCLLPQQFFRNSLLETEHYGHKILMQWSSWSKHVFEHDDSHAISCVISRQEKGGLHKCIARFITYSFPGRADNWFPSIPRKQCTGVRNVVTKFSRMDGLPNFLTHGAPLVDFACRSSATKHIRNFTSRTNINHIWIILYCYYR